jgi:Fe-S-cluster-containing dehydrogenase component/DMSO reductase anchor subunit
MHVQLTEPWIHDDERSLIDELLDEQRDLTAVEAFSQRHSSGLLPAQRRYRDLIPLSNPAEGQQYAFEVDLDACTSCKACVSACHSLNGLEETETWRSVGMLQGFRKGRPYQQTITAACHHCVEPACLYGCPVGAYEKDRTTGIVRHLDDQCIGCQYCILKCPYDVPKYSERLGIVRKCDMCAQRLATDEAPACVQGCPNEAIRITIVDKAAIAMNSAQAALVPGAFGSSYTQPGTRYLSRDPLPATLAPADAAVLRLEPAHIPLIAMLTLTQLAAGMAAAAALLYGSLDVMGRTTVAFAAAAMMAIGLGASVFHLGRPMGAWRAFLGLRTSWLSREIVAFGIFFPMIAAAAAIESAIGLGLMPMRDAFAVIFAAAAFGILSVGCSAMVYVDTRRAFWNVCQTFGKFLGTCAVLGSAGAASALQFADPAVSGLASEVAATLLAAKMIWEATCLAWSQRAEGFSWRASTAASLGPLSAWVSVRFWAGIAAVLLFAFPDQGLVTIAFLLAMCGEVAERWVFFRGVTAPRMPGGLP